MKIVLAVLGVIVVIAVVVIMAAVGSYNNLVGLKQAVDASWANVENVYQRRADLVPNLVKTVEGAANFEKSTLIAVTEARQQVTKLQVNPGAAPTDPATLQKFQQMQDQLSSSLSRLLVVVEKYPELKANANFLDLQAQLEGTENRISVERRKFNETVQGYNTKIQSVPAVFFAAALGFTPRPYFAAKAGADAAPEVNFNFSNGAAPSASPLASPVPSTP
ncbi:LemA family protein [soil metagenome]